MGALSTMPNPVLLVVDVQRDFLPGGALAVPRGDEVVEVINGLLPGYDTVTGTQDWHPPDHASFAANHPGRQPGETVLLHGHPQVLWPVHCVADSPGAEFAPGLRNECFNAVFKKGTARDVDSYSAFFDNDRQRSTGLADYLRAANLREVHICGLATDYCVLWSALDALRLGFEVTVLAEACRGIDLRPGDSRRALESVTAAGGQVRTGERRGDALV